MKTLQKSTATLLLLSTLSGVAQGEVLSTYRAQANHTQPQRDEIEKAAQSRIANIRTALGYKNLKFVEPRTPYQNAKRGLNSSVFLKRLLSKVSDGFHTNESYGKPMTVNPSLFGYEIVSAVNARNQKVCESVIGTDQYGRNKELLIDQLYAQREENRTMREANLQADVANGWRSELANRITDYINSNGHGAILSQLGQIYQIEAIDGLVTRIRFTKRGTEPGSMLKAPTGAPTLGFPTSGSLPFGWKQADEKPFPYVTLSDTEATTLSLEMLATMVSDYDRYFLMGSACLLNFVNKELQEQEKKWHDIVDTKLYKYTCYACKTAEAMEPRIAKLQAVQRYVKEKHDGAVLAHKLIAGLSKKDVYFLADLMLQLRRDDVPVAGDILPLGQLAYNRQKTLSTQAGPLVTTLDHIYYSNLEEELYRLEEHVREHVRTNKVNQQIIQEIKAGR